jgi:hypothetical protein
MKLKVRKEGKKLEKIKNNIFQLNKKYVQVGHFGSQGMHSKAPYDYPALMLKLHVGGSLFSNTPMPPRPLLNILWAKNARLQDPLFKKAIIDWAKRPQTVNSNKKLLDDLGKVLTRKGRALFGKTPPLAVNAPMTIKKKGRNSPLVETGELRDKFSYRNTIDKVIRGV